MRPPILRLFRPGRFADHATTFEPSSHDIAIRVCASDDKAMIAQRYLIRWASDNSRLMPRRFARHIEQTGDQGRLAEGAIAVDASPEAGGELKPREVIAEDWPPVSASPGALTERAADDSFQGGACLMRPGGQPPATYATSCPVVAAAAGDGDGARATRIGHFIFRATGEGSMMYALTRLEPEHEYFAARLLSPWRRRPRRRHRL